MRNHLIALGFMPRSGRLSRFESNLASESLRLEMVTAITNHQSVQSIQLACRTLAVINRTCDLTFLFGILANMQLA